MQTHSQGKTCVTTMHNYLEAALWDYENILLSWMIQTILLQTVIDILRSHCKRVKDLRL